MHVLHALLFNCSAILAENRFLAIDASAFFTRPLTGDRIFSWNRGRARAIYLRVFFLRFPRGKLQGGYAFVNPVHIVKQQPYAPQNAAVKRPCAACGKEIQPIESGDRQINMLYAYTGENRHNKPANPAKPCQRAKDAGTAS